MSMLNVHAEGYVACFLAGATADPLVVGNSNIAKWRGIMT